MVTGLDACAMPALRAGYSMRFVSIRRASPMQLTARAEVEMNRSAIQALGKCGVDVWLPWSGCPGASSQLGRRGLRKVTARVSRTGSEAGRRAGRNVPIRCSLIRLWQWIELWITLWILVSNLSLLGRSGVDNVCAIHQERRQGPMLLLCVSRETWTGSRSAVRWAADSPTNGRAGAIFHRVFPKAASVRDGQPITFWLLQLVRFSAPARNNSTAIIGLHRPVDNSVEIDVDIVVDNSWG